MGTIERAPMAQCDNCGLSEEKKKGSTWVLPDGWGGVKVAATHRGYYPNNIAMSDLCPRCLRAVHYAVTAALKEARNVGTE